MRLKCKGAGGGHGGECHRQGADRQGGGVEVEVRLALSAAGGDSVAEHARGSGACTRQRSLRLQRRERDARKLEPQP
eukprot:1598756-Rhodomonas_salina.1